MSVVYAGFQMCFCEVLCPLTMIVHLKIQRVLRRFDTYALDKHEVMNSSVLKFLLYKTT